MSAPQASCATRDQVLERIRDDQRFVLATHEHPDGDALGSLVAMQGLLVGLGKDSEMFIGPADLSQSMGIPGDWEHPRMWQAVERVAAAAKANNVPWAILPRDAGHARRCVDLGCRMLSLGIDTWAFRKGLQVIQRDDFGEFFA